MTTSDQAIIFRSITFRLMPDMPTNDAMICSGERVYLFRDGELRSFLYVSEVIDAAKKAQEAART